MSDDESKVEPNKPAPTNRTPQAGDEESKGVIYSADDPPEDDEEPGEHKKLRGTLSTIAIIIIAPLIAPPPRRSRFGTTARTRDC